jgi:spore germination cell wall hydrolase CwlJ-like protein
MIVAGAAMVGLFAVAGYQVGNVAVARSVAPVELDSAAQPAPAALRKGSLLAAAPLVEPADSLAAERPIPASLVSAKSDSLTRKRIAERSDRLSRLISPPVELIEKNWQTGREQRRRVAEHKCLSRAIYFEARSESEIGRLAVARVILNRVKSPFYPDSICEVVYQNAERRNACQFSFACNGESDRPRRGKAWEQAKTLATRAMAGEGAVQAIATATHFHADYVQPKWSGAMTRLVKIGRHIFYSGS